MPRLQWGSNGERFYEAGVDRGVLYPKTGPSLVWNGLVSVDDIAEAAIQYAYFDGVKRASNRDPESFSGAISAYTYPIEFGSNEFDLSYRTKIGDDILGIDRGYKIHLVYNALFEPTDSAYVSLDDKVDPTAFNWSFSTRPVLVPGRKASAHVIVDTRKAVPGALAAFENMLYGTVSTAPYFPTPQEVIDLFETNSIVRITDHGDGTWSAEGPDSAVYMNDATSFVIDWPSAVYIDSDTYTVESL